MTLKSGWTELLKWIGWIDVILSSIAALIILKNNIGGTYNNPTNWPMLGLAAGLVIQAFFALGVIMLFCNIHDYVFDISIYIEKISRNQVKGTE